ncbi:MAG TPA: hypothetical protein VKK79_15640, partial [Candidatus Lokiarchaeia archaeon]|nr:hypothetical protein [Candidatus Lokiarchaeia archaeon]
MKVQDVFDRLKQEGSWVNWNHTADHVLFGDGDAEITGIAVGWMPTFPNLQKALDNECNLYVTHEPLYVGIANSFGVFNGGDIGDVEILANPDALQGHLLEEDDAWIKKREWLEQHEMNVLRCHDVWDDFPVIGIHGAWAQWLGFHNPPLKQVKFYEVHDVSGRTLRDVVQQIADHVKILGQECVH